MACIPRRQRGPRGMYIVNAHSPPSGLEGIVAISSPSGTRADQGDEVKST